MKAKIITLGCKVNQYESEAMLEALLAGGFQEAASGEEADVVVVNSCTVTATSDQKVRQTLRRARKENPGAVTVLTGCMPQAFPEEAAALLEADVVLGNARRADLLPRVMEYLSSKQRIVDIAPHEKGEKFERMAVSTFHGRTRAFLKIEDGCDRFCSYCIIPYARGRVRSKPLEDIREEVQRLGEQGFQEVVLTGINLSLYGRELGLRLPDAVEAAASVPGIDRVRIGSLEPELLTDADIARLAAVPQLCGQFHLSLQSGCDATLARMNRHYTTARYREIAGALREKFPGCAITTDVITGFPGETPEEFAETCGFVREMGFAMVHIFPYSERRSTAAASMPDPVPMEERRRRASELAEITAGSARAFYEAQVGTVQMVLIEKKREPDWIRGYTPNYTPVRVRCADDRRGELLPVRITEAGPEGCTGVFAG